MIFLVFAAVVLAITGTSWLIVGTFVHDLAPGGWRTVLIAWLVSVAPFFLFVRNMLAGRYPSALTRLFVFRIFWYSLFLVLPLALASGVLALVALPFGAALPVGRIVVFVAAPLMIAVLVAGYAGSRRLTVRRIEFAPVAMPAPLAGLRIAQMSDLHVGPHTSRAHLRRIAAAVRSADPHLIVYTGDQVDDYPHDVDDLAETLGDLDAPLGRYAIAGNHDVYAGWDEVKARTEAAGIRVLENESVRLVHNGAAFWLAGTGDPAGNQSIRGSRSGAPDIDRTMRGIPGGAFSIVLAHNPALFPALAKRDAGIVLSGHTHHGQFSIPSKNWSLASPFLEYAMGAYELGRSLLYVSPGTNFWGIPFRLGAWPEVTIVTLRARDGVAVRLSA